MQYRNPPRLHRAAFASRIFTHGRSLQPGHGRPGDQRRPSPCAPKNLFSLPQDRTVLDADGAVDTELAREDADNLLASGDLDEDTASFLSHASRAVKRGVARAHLVPYTLDGSVLLEIFTHDGVGTMVVEDTLDDLRPATVDDVGAIVQLIEPLEADGTLVRRGRGRHRTRCGKIHGARTRRRYLRLRGLDPYPDEKMAEMACLIVQSGMAGLGRRRNLLRHAESKARAMGARRLFVLTTRTSHWFMKRGFVQGGISDLPRERQAHYDRSRNSQVFIKKL